MIEVELSKFVEIIPGKYLSRNRSRQCAIADLQKNNPVLYDKIYQSIKEQGEDVKEHI